jgi:ABC-type ATPase involved in cell division
VKAAIEVSTPIARSPRVLQVGSMFDVPMEDRAALNWDADLPIEDQDWHIGMIIGPSGSGKTTIARHFWPEQMAATHHWTPDAALIDDFPSTLGIKDVVGLLNSVGLASPPAWLRPFRTLSNGEAFRADVARTLAETDSNDVTVIDEFTSVVDRQVAQIASHTVQKTVRRQDRQLIAVTCHYDIVDWLQPDWIYDVAAGSFAWRSVQPHPSVEVRIHKIHYSAWKYFRRHHYLSSEINKSARCFGAFIGDDLVAFTSYLHFPHAKTKNVKMAHRVVVLPDYQGLGIGGRLADWQGEYLHQRGYRYHFVTSHPALIRYLAGSPRWRLIQKSTRRSLANTSTDVGLRKRALDPRSLGNRCFFYAPESHAAPVAGVPASRSGTDALEEHVV